MATSNLQQETKERLMFILRDYEVIENYRPDWLVNPLTNKRLELDLWIPQLNAAVEVQGRQHYEFVGAYHRTEQDFLDQVERDKEKRRQCETNGIFLYEVRSPNEIDDFLVEANQLSPHIAWETLKRKNYTVKILAYLAARLYIEKRQKKHKRNEARMKNLVDRMLRISEKYDVPLSLIKPDFTIKKIEIAYLGYPSTKIICFSQDRSELIRTYQAVIRSYTDQIATLSFRTKYTKAEAIEVSLNFSRINGECIEDVSEILERQGGLPAFTVNPNDLVDLERKYPQLSQDIEA